MTDYNLILNRGGETISIQRISCESYADAWAEANRIEELGVYDDVWVVKADCDM